MIKVLMSGGGKMGRALLDGFDAEAEIEPVGALDKLGGTGSIRLPSGREVTLHNDAAEVFDATTPDVCVDFSNAAWTPIIAEAALARGVRLVIGTTGLGEDFVEKLRRDCEQKKVGAVVAANFTIGAVLMMHLAKIAAPYFEAAEIIELHHDQKVDAPSGTSLATAKGMLEARAGRAFGHNVADTTPLPGTRGGETGGVTMHSVRLPGMVAHQEVLFGGLGQTLSIRHDTTGRDCYVPGVVIAIREVMRRSELVVGLDKLLGL